MSQPVGWVARIGEFSRRLGLTPAVLRAWESRYGLFTPERSESGYRLYTVEDERRARLMQAHLDQGMPAAEAARLTLASVPPLPLDHALAQLRRGWDSLDAGMVHRSLDSLLAGPLPEVAATRIILPELERRRAEWARDPAHAGSSHFAERLLEARLLSLVGPWHLGPGEQAVVGCAPFEMRTVEAILVGMALHRRDWRIAYLGAGVPMAAFRAAAAALHPALVVICVADVPSESVVRLALEPLGEDASVVLAGRGASAALADVVGAPWRAGDPLAVASAY